MPCEFINHQWHEILWEEDAYYFEHGMEFTKYNYLLNKLDIPTDMFVRDDASDAEDTEETHSTPSNESGQKMEIRVPPTSQQLTEPS